MHTPLNQSIAFRGDHIELCSQVAAIRSHLHSPSLASSFCSLLLSLEPPVGTLRGLFVGPG